MSANDDKRQKTLDDDEEIKSMLQLIKPPPSLADLTAMTKLELASCNLSELPSALPEAMPNLSILFLPNNCFREVPPVVGACQKLQMVSFKHNGLTSIHPDALQPHLRWLILTDNKIESIPENIGGCYTLQKLMLSGNQIKEVPESISQCTNLELVRLAANQLEQPPLALLSMPSLHWVALSGNPFLKNTKTGLASEKLHLKTLDVPEDTGPILGKGAGGITRKVMWHDHPVAVKKFCGEMTSDGSPDEERRVSLAVSSFMKSEYLIAVEGETEHGSLVMEFLDGFDALAGPPCLKSCTRDVYTCDKSYMTERNATNMVSGLLDILRDMHGHGICHGDFYSHNILVKQSDHTKVKLSDFGAAFFYDVGTDYGNLLEQAELRAFGVFVDEIAGRFGDKKTDLLTGLANICREKDTTFSKAAEWWKEKLNN